MMKEKPLRLIQSEIKTPPFSEQARIEAGFLLRQVQKGIKLSLPESRPMPAIGSGCHELRIIDGNKNWRVVYSIESDAILILEVFLKKTQTTPKDVIDKCRKRLSSYRSC
ncbi:MAG TPA: type II toxin-antitoxin system RelE/ParE family toxin [Leptospiraceae bacterium]|nr:type II toxin-antitoxin system RelE/ParE family toxin [Leptospiraceae bacterium]HRG75683.1 type II toxin-antitoxin system RelE/ParE family toxin [Leptospiraceae bacterium]